MTRLSASGLLRCPERVSSLRPTDVVRTKVLGYPGGVTVRSALDTLEHLRHQVREAEQKQLVARAEAERLATLEQESVLRALQAFTARDEAARREEEQRLAQEGITAAEGLRRAAWETAQRSCRSALWNDHERARDARRTATSEHEQAREALARADAELRQVRERLAWRENAKRRGEEQAQQELLDEAFLRRFLEKSSA